MTAARECVLLTAGWHQTMPEIALSNLGIRPSDRVACWNR
jgi:hypothetical protein